MLVLRKAKKLISNPAIFYKESKFFRYKSILRSQEKIIQPISPIVNCEQFKTRIIHTITNNSRVVWIKPKAGEIKVAFTSSSYLPELANTLYRMETSEIEVTMFTKGGQRKGCTTKEILEEIWKNKICKFRFTSKKDRSIKKYIEVQCWRELPEHISAPKHNKIAMKLSYETLKKSEMLEVGKMKFISDLIEDFDDSVCNFDVDYVFTWVNSDDPDWISLYNVHAPVCISDATSQSRFVSRDELKFSLRSIETYAPWVRKIHIVSNCKPPSWLNLKNNRINWVYHESIIDKKYLPTFNSHAIESCIHKIHGLTNHFIYANDDIILTRPAEKSDFFEPNGNCKLKLEPYGNVIGENHEMLPDYMNASINSQRLLSSRFKYKPTQLHRHTHQALRIDILNEIEEVFSYNVSQTRESKFRTMNDINITSFLFHHYAYYTGKAIKTNPKVILAKADGNFSKIFNEVLSKKNEIFFSDTNRALTLCINDGNDSHENREWNNSIITFLNIYLPTKSQFEI